MHAQHYLNVKVYLLFFLLPVVATHPFSKQNTSKKMFLMPYLAPLDLSVANSLG